jgi:hypothetical protein
MDVSTFTLALAFSLILLLFSFMGSRAGWGLLGLFGSTIAAVCALVLTADGNFTNSGTTIAAANGNFVSDFNLITIVPISVALGEFVVTIRRIFKI